MAKSVQRIEARRLRRKGFSINVIAEKVRFSKRTISRWCNDIELDEKQKELLWSRSKARFNKNFRKYCERKRLKTKRKIEGLKREGVDEVGKLNKRELFIAGVALYWAEGFKKDMRIGFANSDPKMIDFFLKWLKECLKIKDDEISLCLTLNEGHKDNEERIKKYWMDITGIPKKQFTKTFYQKVKWKKKFEKPDEYHGVLRIRVKKSLDLLRKINGYIDGLKKNVS